MCTAHPVCDLEAVSRQAALRLIRLRPRKHSTQEAGRVGYATVRVPTRTSSMPLTEATEAPVRLRVCLVRVSTACAPLSTSHAQKRFVLLPPLSVRLPKKGRTRSSPGWGQGVSQGESHWRATGVR